MKKGIINFITIALVLVNLVLSIILVFVGVPAINKTSNLIDRVNSIVDLQLEDEEGEGTVAVGDIETRSVLFSGDATETTISLAPSSNGETHYILISVTLGLNTKHSDYKELSSSVDSSMSIIASNVINVVSSYKFTDVNKSAIEADVLKALQEMFDSEFIYSVNFNQFTIQ